jgi:glycosyltransferase involved in cell wall biosynthesis
MRIVHVANEVVSTGNGIANSAVDLACLQAEAGHDVSFISSGGGYVDLLQRHNVRHYQKYLYPKSIIKLLRSAPEIRKLIMNIGPDIVHAHMITPAILMRLGRDYAGFGNFGLVTTIHNEWRLSADLMRAGDRVIVLSENGKKNFKGRGFPEHKLCVVRHGILKSPRRREELYWRPVPAGAIRKPMIVTIAGLFKRKGVGDLICAFGQIADEFPAVSLQVLGQGPDLTYFQRLASSVRGAERIHFTGFVAKPHLVLREAAVFVLASHTESFPLAILEAREAGCAIVATEVGGVPELLEHGRAGILIPPRDPDRLALALQRLLRDPAELERWQSAASPELDWLSSQRMSDETLDVYKSLLPRPSSAREVAGSFAK